MKNLITLMFIVLLAAGCKKQHYSPDGPTDVRIRNLSGQTFNDVVVITSEKDGDTLSFGTIAAGTVSTYSRFKKAYPKAEISANINTGGNNIKYTTGPVIFTYMQYIGRDRITFEVNISDPVSHSLIISNVIEEEPLALK